MNKINSTLMMICFVVAFTNAQVMQNRALKNFNSLKMKGAFHLNFTTSDSIKLTVTASENEINNVETKIEEGQLTIENKGSFHNPVKIDLSSMCIKMIEAEGSVVFKTVNQLKCDTLFVKINGASNVWLNALCKNINIQLQGASQATIKGTTQNMDANLKGAAGLKAFDLNAAEANIKTEGAAGARIFCTDKLIANAIGASSIKIKGDPKSLNANASDAASIVKISSNKNTGTESGNDTTILKLKRKNILIVNGDESGKKKSIKRRDTIGTIDHWKGFYLGVNGFVTTQNKIDLPKNWAYLDLNYSRSFNCQINPIEKHFNLYKNYVKVLTGLGIDWHQYSFNNSTQLNADSNYTWGKIDTSNYFRYVKNKFISTYIQVPLLVEINTSKNKNKSFHFTFGVIGQYLIASKTVQELTQNKYEITKTRKDDYNLSPFVAKAHVSVGYKKVSAYAEYNLTPLFKHGKGPMLYPFSIGVNFPTFN